MLTVAILKNGQPILARSAVNRLKESGAYICDDGTLIEHDPQDGAIALAKKMLDTIDERFSQPDADAFKRWLHVRQEIDQIDRELAALEDKK